MRPRNLRLDPHIARLSLLRPVSRGALRCLWGRWRRKGAVPWSSLQKRQAGFA